MPRRFSSSVPVLILALLLCIGALAACGNGSGPPSSETPPPPSEGFTFFNLTAESRFSSDLRKELERRLGSDAIARRSTIDLQIPPESFLSTHFPEIYELNRRLNYSPRERIEHNVTKLMYRYPGRQQLPFSFVELLFSNYTAKPLVFHTSAKQEGATVLQTLEDKYGSPDVATWDGGSQQAYFWQKPGERMIVYALRDRFGSLEYQVQLLFLEAIEELVRTEEKEREARAREKQEAVREAF